MDMRQLADLITVALGFDAAADADGTTITVNAPTTFEIFTMVCYDFTGPDSTVLLRHDILNHCGEVADTTVFAPMPARTAVRTIDNIGHGR